MTDATVGVRHAAERVGLLRSSMAVTEPDPTGPSCDVQPSTQGERTVRQRVAFFIPSLRGGGAERSMIDLAHAVADQGYAVDLVAANATGVLATEVPGSVRLIDLRSPRVLYALPRLVRYLRRARPYGLMAAMGHVNVIAVTAAMIARVRTRVIVSERSTLSAAGATRTIRTRVVRQAMGWFYRRAHAIVAVSMGVADDLAVSTGIARSAINVIYNPVVTSRLIGLSRQPVDHPWANDAATPMILAVGRLTAAKDFATLIRAFAIVRSSRACRLVILGEGELRADLENLVQELRLEADVLLPGFVENPFAWMSRAAVFVLSSAWEGLPGVLIQAMACGTPVVSTDCRSGPAEILEDGRWGALAEVGNPRSIATAIEATLSRPSHPVVEQRARHFRTEHAVSKFLGLLERNK